MLQGPGKLPPATLPKEALIERYKTHTCSCKICSGALRNVRIIRGVAKSAAVVASAMATAGRVARALAPALSARATAPPASGEAGHPLAHALTASAGCFVGLPAGRLWQ